MIEITIIYLCGMREFQKVSRFFLSLTLIITNKDLKEIAAICKIDKTLTSYVARHSFANSLKQIGVATDIISESLGHQNLAITQAYLEELDSSVLDEASRLLL